MSLLPPHHHTLNCFIPLPHHLNLNHHHPGRNSNLIYRTPPLEPFKNPFAITFTSNLEKLALMVSLAL